MIGDKRGQIRIIEALFTCIILLASFSAASLFSGLYTVSEAIELEEVGINLLHVLDNSMAIERILHYQGNWESELEELMRTLIPPDTFYNLTLFSAITGQMVVEVTNIMGQDLSSGIDVATIQYVATVSFPYLKQENLKHDVMLIIDRSASMNEKESGDEHSKIYYAKEAAEAFVDHLNMSLARVGVVSFSDEATLDVQLTDNSTEIKSAIDSLSPSGYTNIGDGINKSMGEFQTNGRADSIWSAILLSDGRTNQPCPCDPPCNPYTGCDVAREYALNEAEMSAEMGIGTYTIGLGADTNSFDEDLLLQIATKRYYYAPSAEDLIDIYTAIAKDLLFKIEYDVVVLRLTLMRAG